MRFTILAACLLFGASTATAQQPAQKPSLKTKFMTNMNASVGGSDDCNSAVAISGAGTFNFDNSAATTGADGQNESICYDFGSSAVDNDVWFLWTADATGTALIETCTGTSMDSKLVAYPSTGGCPAPGSSIACNDDACALQSGISFACTTGADYIIQLGNYAGATPGSGSLNASISGPLTNDDCASPGSLAGQGQFPYNLFGATTGTAGQTEYACVNFGTSAVDHDMIPLIDIGVSDFDADNHNGNLGFVPGDTLDLSVEVTNYGVDPYSDSGEISIYELVGLDEVYVGGSAITNLASGATQTLTIQFDTSDIEPYASGSTTFRAQLSGLTGDRVASNNYADDNALHDMAPVSNQPTSIASTSIERGESIQFESTALSNDMVDDMSTMTPSLHYAESGTELWDNSWIASADLVGSGGNARYVYTIDAPLNAEVGDYDLRVRWVDAGGQYGDWLVSEGAFELRNALPTVLNSDYPQYAGMPTVKVETQERISIAGLVNDAETPLSMLQIDSNSPEFIEWDPTSLEIVVEFDEVIRDIEGNPIPQGMFVTVDDGDDSNSGMMMFNVVENGAPRWSPVPSQSFFEGGSASFGLAEYLSDTDDNGYPVPVSDLTLELIQISNEALVDASVLGHTLSVNALDDDSTGSVDLMLRASDGIKFSDTVITFHVLNVNDAPRIDMTGIEEFTIEMGDRITLELLDRMTDIDDPDEEIWATAMTFVAGAAQFNPITGILTMAWDEAGTEIVTITLEDRHGDASAYMITVTVVDEMPLFWGTDLVAAFSTVEYGSNPSITIENIGQHVLSDIRITWTVCNSITGICHSSGVSHNLGPFIVYPVSGEGLGVGDYITLTAEGEDEDGFDRVTEEQFRVYATEAEEVIEEPEEEVSDTKTGGMSSMMSAGFIAIGLLLAVALVMALAIVLRRQGLDSESAIDFASEIEVYEEGNSYSTDLTGEAPPPPPMTPPLPPEGLPPGWTMEQWHYYGAEYLRRRG